MIAEEGASGKKQVQNEKTGQGSVGLASACPSPTPQPD